MTCTYGAAVQRCYDRPDAGNQANNRPGARTFSSALGVSGVLRLLRPTAPALLHLRGRVVALVEGALLRQLRLLWTTVGVWTPRHLAGSLGIRSLVDTRA